MSETYTTAETTNVTTLSDVWYGFNLFYVALGLLGLSTIISNGFIIGFYQDKWKQIVPLMYNMIAICDSVTGVVTVCHACIFTFGPVHSEKGRTYIIAVFYTVLQTITRTSLFYNTMLAVARTINITRPFYRINKRVMVCCAIFFPLFFGLIFMIDVFVVYKELKEYYIELNIELIESYFLFDIFPGQGILSKIMPSLKLALIISGIPLILPVIISLICAVVQIHSILKPSVISPPSNRERRMTMTIIMLTLVCLICNIPITLYLFSTFYLYSGYYYATDGHRDRLIYCYVLHTLLPFIQAILNPTILLQRGEALRTFVVITFRRLFNCLNSSRNTNELEMVVINNGASAMG